MDVNRRKLIKKTLGASLLIATPKILLAEDYSNKNNPEQRKYQYNPYEENLRQQNSYITNNILPGNNGNQQDFWNLPRTININRRQTGENAKIVYHNDGRINEEGYRLACYLLRDVQQGAMVSMDLRLLDLICAVQSWLIYYGFNGPMMVNSGYRTLRTNSGLEGAAKNSMHLYGRAIDFTVPGLSPINLARIAAQFRAGGIGIYPNQNFVHLDTGGVRVWVKK